MGMSCNWPNFNAWLETAWGAGAEFSVTCGAFYGATNLVFGQNPPYYLDDFRAIYPKFFGLPTALSGCGTLIGTNTVSIPSMAGLDFGQFVQSSAFPPGTIITGIGSGTVTLNNNALVTNANATLMIFEASPIPTGVILLYLNLAYSSLVQARWQEQWVVAMGWFIAHYCTLYARSDASEVFETLQTTMHTEVPAGTVPGTVYTLSSIPPGGVLQSLTKNGLFLIPNGVDYTLNGLTLTLITVTVLNDKLAAVWPVQTQVFTSPAPNGAQVAAQGLAGGIQTSKSVGDVSVSYQVLTSLEDWGAWNLTTYGQQLATMAKVVGSGPMVIW